jgi:pimeloyl-ACP methyl ester carboxylesterase
MTRWIGAAAVIGAVLGSGVRPARGQDPCAILKTVQRARCATIEVFENRAAGTGRKIPIRYLVLSGKRPASREPLFIFAGGPGQGSTDMAPLAEGPFAPILEVRDVVLVDQRGTGGSNPLLCPVDLVREPRLAFGHAFDPEVFRRCRPELERHADLRYYTTELAVEDIDDVRRALGADKVLLWGGSYGTRLAQAYMKAHADHVVAAVLDGVVPFDFRAPAGYAASLQQSLDRVFADCAADPTCHTRHPGVAAEFGRLVARLAAGPIEATVKPPSGQPVTVPLSAGDFAYAVRGILYSSNGARELPGLVARADSSGDLSAFAQRYWGRAADFEGFADGLHFAIFCAEDVQFINEPEIAGLVKGTFMGTYLIDEYRTVCRDWVTAPVGPKVREPLRASVPTLLVTGWFDPVTPPETAERVGRELPVHQVLMVRNEAHGAGFGCARPAVLHVLVKGTLEGVPSVCEGVTNLWAKPQP